MSGQRRGEKAARRAHRAAALRDRAASDPTQRKVARLQRLLTRGDDGRTTEAEDHEALRLLVELRPFFAHSGCEELLGRSQAAELALAVVAAGD